MTRSRTLRTALMITAGAAALAAPAAALSAPLAEGGVQGGTDDPAIRLVEKPVRTIQPLASEYVPAYTCPASHPYLVDERFSGNVPAALRGILVRRSSPGLDVSITGPRGIAHPLLPGRQLLHGIEGGFMSSHVMNWDAEANSYQIIMKCTSNPSLGKDVTNIASLI